MMPSETNSEVSASQVIAAAPLVSARADPDILTKIVRAALPQLPRSATNPDALLPTLHAAAAAALAKLTFPTPRVESWKYTNFRALHDAHWFAPRADGDTPAPSSTKRSARFAATSNICIHNGHPYRVECERVAVLQLNKAVGQAAAEVVGDTVTDNDADTDSVWRALFAAGIDEPFACLNALTTSDPLLARVPAQTDGGTLRVTYTTSANEQFHCAARLGVHLGAGSTLTLIEEIAPTAGLHNSVTDIELAAGATLKHIRWTNIDGNGLSLARVFVRVGADATYNGHQQLDLGAQIREEIDVALQGSGARAALSGAACVARRDQADLIVRLRHEAPHSSSAANYRGLAGERGRLAFNGRIHILPNAMDVDASLTNKNLLLSRDAEIDTKPELEIYADDVRCSHGATVGQIDANALFYLQSRGIDASAASVLLRRGFALSALSTIAEGAERDVLMNLLLERLEAMA